MNDQIIKILTFIKNNRFLRQQNFARNLWFLSQNRFLFVLSLLKNVRVIKRFCFVYKWRFVISLDFLQEMYLLVQNLSKSLTYCIIWYLNIILLWDYVQFCLSNWNFRRFLCLKLQKNLYNNTTLSTINTHINKIFLYSLINKIANRPWMFYIKLERSFDSS